MRHLGQHAVDAGAHFDGLFPRLNVKIAGVEPDGVLHHAVDQRDDFGSLRGNRFGLEIIGGVAHIGVRLGSDVEARYLNSKAWIMVSPGSAGVPPAS